MSAAAIPQRVSGRGYEAMPVGVYARVSTHDRADARPPAPGDAILHSGPRLALVHEIEDIGSGASGSTHFCDGPLGAVVLQLSDELRNARIVRPVA